MTARGLAASNQWPDLPLLLMNILVWAHSKMGRLVIPDERIELSIETGEKGFTDTNWDVLEKNLAGWPFLSA